MNDQPPNQKYITEEHLDLRLKALVSQMTTRMVVAIAIGAGVSQAQIPTEVTVGAIVAAVCVPAAKGVLALYGSR